MSGASPQPQADDAKECRVLSFFFIIAHNHVSKVVQILIKLVIFLCSNMLTAAVPKYLFCCCLLQTSLFLEPLGRGKIR